ncbi:polyketide synthase [Streptomyces sp. NRRL F-2890]|uniref:beta-ketoacyl [acyl carrier protein] synthase domain-containing protein n=1 Tax=Streptomyces sp. NRRL F-2890 TaxID=1463845 RepID=UPI0006941BCA|nr:polyketide synthase [Streptomyces sp. NRRL F-2890]
MTTHQPGETRPPAEPIAVIGMACRLPGAAGPAQLWDLLCRGAEAPGPHIDDIDHVEGTGAHTAETGVTGHDRDATAGAGTTAESAATIDPQQRLLLRTAREALADAGSDPATLAGTRTAVFAGQSQADHWERLRETRAERRMEPLAALTDGGQQRSVLAGRLSYALGLHGPCVTVDTGQASSLTAVHLACTSLRAGESTLALAGGVNAVLSPVAGDLFGRAGVLAADRRCKFADASADGFVRADGVGVVVLKPLRAALADGDRVRAVILGSAVSHDGATKQRLTDPSVTGQRLAMRWAYEAAGAEPGRVGYVEAHGTGTGIDRIELAALNEELAAGRPVGRPLLVGSVKTNIGHCEAAAGVAGLIKTVLCLEHRAVPPSLHFTTPSPEVEWGRLPITVPTAIEPLPSAGSAAETDNGGDTGTGPALAAVNGQSICGVNVHLVLSAAPPAPESTGPPPYSRTAVVPAF